VVLCGDLNDEPDAATTQIIHIFASYRLVNPQRLPTVHTVQTAETLPSVDETPTARRNEPGSDHAAVVASFDL
jgi:endonuclease/exonuclease/phosphatase family metal-dependent hydrolase